MKASVLAEAVGAILIGEDREISGVNALDTATIEQVSFLANPKYEETLSLTKAGCVILTKAHAQKVACALVSENPYLSFARAVQLFAKPKNCMTGISELAYIHPEAVVDSSAVIYPFVFIGKDSKIGVNTIIYSGVFVGDNCIVGKNTIIYPNVSILADTVVGDNVILHAGVVVGSDGFGFAQGDSDLVKFPQIGNVVINNDVEIGANSTIDRAALGSTQILTGTKIDNQVQIGHNVKIGAHSIIVAQVGIAGSTTIGNQVVIGGQSGIAGHISIGDRVKIAGQTGVNSNLQPDEIVGSGFPAMPYKIYLRTAAALPRLPELSKRVKFLERELAQLRSKIKEINIGD